MFRVRTLLALTACVFAVVLAFAFAGCTTILGDFEVAPAGGNQGRACTTAAECASGFCADGVCCDTACNGVCETCAAPGSVGTCAPHAAGTDPESECKPAPRADAGTIQPLAAGDDGGVTDGGNGSGEAGVVLNVPDGGLSSDDKTCAGSCDGNRKCAYPGREKVCGTQFCNSSAQAVAYACDQKGNCELDIASCEAYTCQGVACKTQCTSPADCAATHFCNSNGQCQPRLANGIVCQIGTQCASGFCADGVCCNSECNQIPGGTCKKAGSEGTCSCALPCANGCRLFYRDQDSDGHGNKDLQPVGSNVVAGCVGDPPPVGYATVKDDCNDADNRVFPGQTGFFESAANVTGGFDFDCDGKTDKETAEYPGGTCVFCPAPVTFPAVSCPKPTATCSVDGQQANLDCRLSRDRLTGRYTCAGLRGDAYEAGFTAEVRCGDQGPFVDCGACTTKGTGPTRPVTDNRRQRCR